MNKTMFNKAEILSRLASSYDHSAKDYATARAPERVVKFVAEELDFFVSQLSEFPSTRILDLGSGPGDESDYIRNKYGIIPECIDISPEMLKLCGQKNLPTRKEDFSTLSDSDNSIDGALMNLSFLHTPKAKAPEVLEEIRRVLRPGGVLQVTLFEGQMEELEKKTKYKYPRFFAYYQQDELRLMVSRCFEVIRENKLESKPRNLLSVTGKKTS